MQHGAKRSGTQDEDSLPTDEELKAIMQGQNDKVKQKRFRDGWTI